MWQLHKHLVYIFPQAKQRKWLMEIMEPTLGCNLVLDSIYSHGLYLGRGLHLAPYNTLWTSSWGLNWNDFFSHYSQMIVAKFSNYESCNFACS
jgi:hypothetical protein